MYDYSFSPISVRLQTKAACLALFVDLLFIDLFIYYCTYYNIICCLASVSSAIAVSWSSKRFLFSFGPRLLLTKPLFLLALYKRRFEAGASNSLIH